jgi:hypothetical protein
MVRLAVSKILIQNDQQKNDDGPSCATQNRPGPTSRSSHQPPRNATDEATDNWHCERGEGDVIRRLSTRTQPAPDMPDLEKRHSNAINQKPNRRSYWNPYERAEPRRR